MSQYNLNRLFQNPASQEPRYYLNKVDVNICGSTLSPGKVVFLTWTVTGTPGYEECYAAVRPIADLHSNEAIVTEVDKPHPQCGGSSTNIKIPKQPINQSYPFDGSRFIVRVNTNQTNGIYADSCTFKIAPHTPPNWPFVMSIISLCISTFATIILAGNFKWLDGKREKKKEQLKSDVKDEVEEEIGDSSSRIGQAVNGRVTHSLGIALQDLHVRGQRRPDSPPQPNSSGGAEEREHSENDTAHLLNIV